MGNYDIMVNKWTTTPFGFMLRTGMNRAIIDDPVGDGRYSIWIVGFILISPAFIASL
jgi:hypothetical protein